MQKQEDLVKEEYKKIIEEFKKRNIEITPEIEKRVKKDVKKSIGKLFDNNGNLKLNIELNGLIIPEQKEANKIDEINEPEEFLFVTEITGVHYINSLPEHVRPGFIAQLRLIHSALINPKMSYEKMLSLPLDKFNALIESFVRHSKKYPTLATSISLPPILKEKKKNSILGMYPMSNMHPDKD